MKEVRFCKRCRIGHPVDEWVITKGGAWVCWRRKHLAALRYYDSHTEQHKAAVAAWRRANPEKVAEYNRRYRETHREKVNALERARYWERKAARIGAALDASSVL